MTKNQNQDLGGVRHKFAERVSVSFIVSVISVKQSITLLK